MGASSGAGTTFPSEAPEVTPLHNLSGDIH
jgi:hypothetical protein